MEKTATIPLIEYEELRSLKERADINSVVFRTVIRKQWPAFSAEATFEEVEYDGPDKVFNDLKNVANKNTISLHEKDKEITNLEDERRKLRGEVIDLSHELDSVRPRSDMYLKIAGTWWFRLFAGKKYRIAK